MTRFEVFANGQSVTWLDARSIGFALDRACSFVRSSGIDRPTIVAVFAPGAASGLVERIFPGQSPPPVKREAL